MHGYLDSLSGIITTEMVVLLTIMGWQSQQLLVYDKHCGLEGTCSLGKAGLGIGAVSVQTLQEIFMPLMKIIQSSGIRREYTGQ